MIARKLSCLLLLSGIWLCWASSAALAACETNADCKANQVCNTKRCVVAPGAKKAKPAKPKKTPPPAPPKTEAPPETSKAKRKPSPPAAEKKAPASPITPALLKLPEHPNYLEFKGGMIPVGAAATDKSSGHFRFSGGGGVLYERAILANATMGGSFDYAYLRGDNGGAGHCFNIDLGTRFFYNAKFLEPYIRFLIGVSVVKPKTAGAGGGINSQILPGLLFRGNAGRLDLGFFVEAGFFGAWVHYGKGDIDQTIVALAINVGPVFIF